MKSVNQKSPISLLLAVFAVLTLLMLATRTHHFATFNSLPSASIAIFFLAGMYLRNMKSFWFFYVLSVTIDLASSYYRGQFGDCITTSYPALVLSYGAMFVAGFYAKPNWQQTAWQFNIIKVALAYLLQVQLLSLFQMAVITPCLASSLIYLGQNTPRV